MTTGLQRSRGLRWSTSPVYLIVAAATALSAGALIGVGNGRLIGVAMIAVVMGMLMLALRTAPLRSTRRHGQDVLGTFGFACICAALPLVTLNALRVSHSLSFGDPLLVLGAGVALVRGLRSGLRAGSVPLWLPVAAIGLLIAGLLAAFHGNVQQDLIPTLEFAGTMFGMPLVVMLAADSIRRVEFIVEAWLLAASLSAIVAVLDLKLGLGIGRRLTGIDYILPTKRAPGLSNHPNHLAVITAMAMPVAALRASLRMGPNTFTFANARNLLYVFAIGAGVFASGSRGGLAAAVAGIAVLPMLQPGLRRSLALCLTGVLIIGVLGALIFDSSFASKLGIVTGQRLSGQAAGTQVSNDYRTRAYAAALRDAIANPIAGQGFESVRTAHNIYLELAQTGGVIGLAAFLAFVSGVLATARRLSASTGLEASVGALASAFGASFVAWLVAGLVEPQLYDRYLYIPVGLLLALHLIALPLSGPQPCRRRHALTP